MKNFPYIYGWIWVGTSFLTRCGWVWPFLGWVWVGVSECANSWLGLGGCGWVWPFFGWVWVGVTFFWLGVRGCDLFLAGCGWVWVGVIFLWLGVGGCDLFLAGCNLFLAGCGWMWSFFGWVRVDVTFSGRVWVGVGECTIYNCPFWNEKPIHCHILHHSSVLLHITPL